MWKKKEITSSLSIPACWPSSLSASLAPPARSPFSFPPPPVFSSASPPELALPRAAQQRVGPAPQQPLPRLRPTPSRCHPGPARQRRPLSPATARASQATGQQPPPRARSSRRGRVAPLPRPRQKGAETLRTPLQPFPRSPFALARAEEAATTAAALAGSTVREQPFPSPRRPRLRRLRAVTASVFRPW